MSSRCPRCGEAFEIYVVEQRRCRRCEQEVQRLIEADARRHVPRFRAKDFSGLRGLVL